MKKIFALLAIFLSIAVNSVMGAGLASVVGVSPAIGAVALNGVGFVAGALNLIPEGIARAGIFTEIWTGELIKAFRNEDSSVGWYNAIRSYDQYVNHDVIHFVDLGGDPTVLVNNTSYPLEIEELSDGDKAVSLDKFQSKPTRITDDELHASSYDKMAVVIEKHKEKFDEVKYSRAIHALAPAQNAAKTPVLKTTGEADSNGRKRITRADVIALKKAFDKMRIPKAGRILVLCADHVADLLETDQKFANQYYNYENGKITKMYGFDVYEFDDTPLYTLSNLHKVAYGAVASEGDMQASVAFTTKRAMRANGSTKSYLKEAADDPQNQENLFSMRTYSICLPLKAEGLGAIVSDVAEVESNG